MKIGLKKRKGLGWWRHVATGSEEIKYDLKMFSMSERSASLSFYDPLQWLIILLRRIGKVAIILPSVCGITGLRVKYARNVCLYIFNWATQYIAGEGALCCSKS